MTTVATPAIDLDESHCFLNALGEGPHVFQLLREREGCAVRPHILEGDLDTHKAALARANERGAGVFVTINEAVGGRKKENIKSVRALFVDLDGAEIGPVLMANPNIVVETSPDRYHAYWLAQDIPLSEFESSQRKLIERFDADPVVKDLPRTMRLPGFYHQKRDPFFVRIISIDEEVSGYA